MSDRLNLPGMSPEMTVVVVIIAVAMVATNHQAIAIVRNCRRVPKREKNTLTPFQAYLDLHDALPRLDVNQESED